MYSKPLDLWNSEIDSKLRTGVLKLQSGQWVKCGSDTLSVFDSASAHHIRCFHGSTNAEALRKYRQFKQHRRDALARRV